MPKGQLKIQTWIKDTYVPVENAKVTVIQSGETKQTSIEKSEVTNSSGLTPNLELNAPPFEYSQNPSANLPYSLVDVKIEADGFLPVLINGCQIYPDRVAYQKCELISQQSRLAKLGRQTEQIINIQPNRLVGDYPAKIEESPEKPLPPPSSGFVVLQEPVVPEFVVVHQGLPSDNSVPNYTVRYKDYIKNVASSEIFSTWPEATIRANVYAIISFTLNRIYTEWYRSKGKPFDITSSTAYDHAFSYGRNIYDNISAAVDDIFSTYMKRPGVKQPLLSQYCDGVKVQCPGWMTQWGSKYLGDEGKVPYEILTNFYGNDLDLVTADQVDGIPKSWPGYTLSNGSRGRDVRSIQTYLNRISDNYPAIPKVSVDGIYGADTERAVRVFQQVFTLPTSGNVDYATWYKISEIYVGVTGIAELRCEEFDYRSSNKGIFIPPSVNQCIYNNTPYIFYPKNK